MEWEEAAREQLLEAELSSVRWIYAHKKDGKRLHIPLLGLWCKNIRAAWTHEPFKHHPYAIATAHFSCSLFNLRYLSPSLMQL